MAGLSASEHESHATELLPSFVGTGRRRSENFPGVAHQADARPALACGAVSVTPINAFSAVPTSPSGHRNSVAAARAELHDAVPAGQWNAVLAEVARIQQSTAATPLQAYETVLAKLAAGWMPSR